MDDPPAAGRALGRPRSPVPPLAEDGSVALPGGGLFRASPLHFRPGIAYQEGRSTARRQPQGGRGLVAKLLTRSFALCALAVGAFGVAALPAAAETVKIQRSIPFGPTAQVPAAVKDSCQLQTKVPAFVKEAAGSSVELVDGPLNRKVGRVLEMEISEVHAPGGGAFSGPKWMSVKGELYDRGKQIGSFRAKRFTARRSLRRIQGHLLHHRPLHQGAWRGHRHLARGADPEC